MKIDAGSSPHRRYNPLSGEWILVSPHRAARPWHGQTEAAETRLQPSYDPECPLCPGNVRSGGIRNPQYKESFVFTNDFAALLPDADAGADSHADSALMRSAPARGTARVICFSPDHAKSLPLMSPDEVLRVVDLWALQLTELGKTWQYVQIFENRGAVMGCSCPHPHGQIWATDYVPQEPLRELKHQQDYFTVQGRPLLLDYVREELELGERVVFETEHFAVLVPYWAFWPYETLLLPKNTAVASLDALTSGQRADLAVAIGRLTCRYDNLFACAFPYSMGWHNPPFDGGRHQEWQLHAHCYPPLLRSAAVRKFVAGFELLAERQRDMTPEQAARTLRALSDVHYTRAVS